MATPVQNNYYTVPQEDCDETSEDIHFFPRCSTPISAEPRSFYFLEENKPSTSGIQTIEKSGAYCEWKKRLEHEKSSRQFKLRAIDRSVESCDSENCTMISGYLGIKLKDQIIKQETISTPAPIYHQLWLPVSYQSFFNPSAMNNSNSHINNIIDHNKTNHDYQDERNLAKYEIQQPKQSPNKYFDRAPGAGVFRTTRNPGSESASNKFLNLFNNTDHCYRHHYHQHYHHHHHHHHHHHYNSLQYGIQEQNFLHGTQNVAVQCNVHNYGTVPAVNITASRILPLINISMRNSYHQYQYNHHHHYNQTPFAAHSSSEIQRTIKYVNVPVHGGNVMITS